MNPKTAALIAVFVAATSLICLTAEDTEAIEVVENETYYCYGNDPMLIPKYPGVSHWNVDQTTGATYRENEDGSITVNLDNVPKGQEVRVTQTVGSDVAVAILIPMHVVEDENDTFTVRFYDMGEMVAEETFETHTVVIQGDPFLVVPADLFREGYVFGGWFTDPSCSDEFRLDPTDPVVSDMDVHAKWTSSGQGGGTHTIVVDGGYIVTFEPVNGLRYDVVSVSGDSIRFTVSVVDGYTFDVGSIAVDANGTRLLPGEDGSYTLSDIDEDILVRITGDRVYSIDYRIDHASVSVDGYPFLPSATIAGAISISVSSDFGWAGLKVSVFMDGRDVTADCVDGDTVRIAEVTGDLVIVAESTIPWLYILVAAIVVIAVAAVYLVYRRRSSGEDQADPGSE